ncbi:hypothetical protein [Deinococcus maricopensis]|uniref:LTD domain-containing protein n=1 Tax=Deinococcus maricopensis (strain DSM 21211 / LMG 22137 / NRRL B-23946 / LB-34) TaxID=709986 RepID=E8U867_DEIML|nr:hypothetical protein [Deinococcus maricopensis]ADV67256.1 hypothetical protein Deima_1607 [Deinococcus maricopensis DSM 21211]
MLTRQLPIGLALTLLLAACQTTTTAPIPTTVAGTTGTAAALPAGTWTFAGTPDQYAYVQLTRDERGARVNATMPGDYRLRDGDRTLTYHAEGPRTGRLNLTEVSLNARPDASGWVELYNGTGEPLNLRDYALRAPARTTNGATAPRTFALPDQTLAPGAYVLVTGRLDPNAQNGPQAVFIGDADHLPAWQDHATVQLLRGEAVQDTLQFNEGLSASSAGTVRVARVGASAVSSVARTPDALRSALGASSADQWTQTLAPSPGAPNNDALSSAAAQGLAPLATGDTDNDGIPDTYETATSGPYNGIYVYNLGARVNQRDIFLELDWMNSSSAFIQPQRAGIDKMVNAFRVAGYALHVDAGYAFSAGFSPENYNLGGGNQLGYSACISIGFASSSCGGILNYKYGTTRYSDGSTRNNFSLNRLNLFRYGVIGNSQQSNGSNGSSGVAEIAGNDFVVTMGGWSYASLTQVANQQGSTIMHEFGHTLNLRHGGFENTNNKPNYYSIMNYTYQLAGLDDTPDRVWERAKQRLGSCSALTYNDPCMTSFKMDYSYGQGGRIDEGAVNENNGINRGAAWIDWNNNGYVNTNVRADVNGDGYVSTGTYSLNDYNDWANIRATFGYVNPNDPNTDVNGAGVALPRLDVAANDTQPAITETNHE